MRRREIQLREKELQQQKRQQNFDLLKWLGSTVLLGLVTLGVNSQWEGRKLAQTICADEAAWFYTKLWAVDSALRYNEVNQAFLDNKIKDLSLMKEALLCDRYISLCTKKIKDYQTDSSRYSVKEVKKESISNKVDIDLLEKKLVQLGQQPTAKDVQGYTPQPGPNEADVDTLTKKLDSLYNLIANEATVIEQIAQTEATLDEKYRPAEPAVIEAEDPLTAVVDVDASFMESRKTATLWFKAGYQLPLFDRTALIKLNDLNKSRKRGTFRFYLANAANPQGIPDTEQEFTLTAGKYKDIAYGNGADTVRYQIAFYRIGNAGFNFTKKAAFIRVTKYIKEK